MITARVSPAPSSSPTRSNSFGTLGLDIPPEDEKMSVESRPGTGDNDAESSSQAAEDDGIYDEKDHVSESTHLLSESKPTHLKPTDWLSLPRRIIVNFISSVRWVFAAMSSPGVYLMACFYDESGKFAPMTQLKKLFGVYPEHARRNAAHHPYTAGSRQRRQAPAATSVSKAASSSTSSLPSETDSEDSHASKQKTARSISLQSTEDDNNSRRSIRIKLAGDDAVRQRRHRKTASMASRKGDAREELSAHLKSPTSPIAALTKYPKAPAPPRPLIPRRQPSYLNLEPSRKHLKTLILDLDETLIHSMSKGGRSSSGHMVEVRLNAASLGLGGGGAGGMAQHPILYWVNKRPYCDEFLRRVCKWYNLVVFTASVQEYADPVIDWLESEKKFFSARYYRQHCTFRQGAYIKDLSSVEPDLSKVMILDNSPLSYLFHEGILLILLRVLLVA